MNENKLQARVNHINTLARLHESLREPLAEAAQRLVADRIKIFTAQGTLTVAANARLPKLPNGSYYRVTCSQLTAVLYHEAILFDVALVYTTDGVTPLPAPVAQPQKSDWTVEEVLRLRSVADAAESALNRAVSDLRAFGRY